jgi:hypothetical protein
MIDARRLRLRAALDAASAAHDESYKLLLAAEIRRRETLVALWACQKAYWEDVDAELKRKRGTP